MRTFTRRVISISTALMAASALSTSAPLWLPAVALIGLLRRRRFVLLRLTLMAWSYAVMECLGVVGALFIGLRHRAGSERQRDASYRLQAWWAGTLYRVLVGLFRLDVQVEHAEALERGPYLLATRHTSLADTLLPAAIVAAGRGMRLRYVLKKELLLDPCLDLVGHQLPNHFVDRSRPSQSDLDAIGDLARDLGPNDGVVLYPEGTFFTPAKRAVVLESLERRNSPRLPLAQKLTHTLPPRPAGLSALLDAAPDLDVVLFAHEGFDRLVHLREMLDGSLVGARVSVGFRRVAAADIPREREARTQWLYEAWSWVDERARRAPEREGPEELTPLPRPATESAS